MLDIRFIRDNAELVQQSARDKGYDVSIDELLRLDDSRRELQGQVDALRERRNQNAARMKGGKPEQSLIDEGKQIKIELAEREGYLTQAEQRFNELLSSVPNVIQSDVPIGDESASVEVARFGDQTDKPAVDHLDFATKRGWVDFERGSKVAGAKFYYLKN